MTVVFLLFVFLLVSLGGGGGGEGNTMRQCIEFKDAYDSVRWWSCIIFSLSLISP